MIAQQLTSAIVSGSVLPGDCVLYRYSRPGPIQRMIARTQRRALADLGADAPADAHLFTHAGMVFDCWLSVEMTSPRARLIPWTRRMEGVAEIRIVRPAADQSPALLRQAAVEGYEDVFRRIRYPHREILLYWAWSWGWQKLHGKTPFYTVFRSRERNVCSGSVVDWWTRAGLALGLAGLDTWPEAWYPARLLADCLQPAPHFQIVAHDAPKPTQEIAP